MASQVRGLGVVLAEGMFEEIVLVLLLVLSLLLTPVYC